MRNNIWLLGIILYSTILIGCSRGMGEKIYNENNSADELFVYEITSQENKKEEINKQESVESESVQDTDTYGNDEKSNIEEKSYIMDDYGEIQEYGGEFYYDEDTKGFYYNIESFYLNSDFLYSMNDTLEEFYDEYLHQYLQTQDWYMEQGKQELPEGNVPYSKLIFQGIQYVDYDYISILFADVTYMGGATAYSRFDAITLDRHTGKEVKASEILGQSDVEILETVNELMGLDEETDWENLDFYLKDEKIVFFYRIPGFWEDVILGR